MAGRNTFTFPFIFFCLECRSNGWGVRGILIMREGLKDFQRLRPGANNSMSAINDLQTSYFMRKINMNIFSYYYQNKILTKTPSKIGFYFLSINICNPAWSIICPWPLRGAKSDYYWLSLRFLQNVHTVLKISAQSVVCGPTALVSPRNLFKIQNL